MKEQKGERKAAKERPEIELYLYSMNQEFPVEKGHQTFLERHSKVLPDVNGQLRHRLEVASHTYKTGFDDWSAEWMGNKWVQDYAKVPSSPDIPFGDDVFKSLIVRGEDFGGLVLDPVHDRVYKVNRAGYDLLNEIVEAAGKKKGLAKFRSKKYTATQCRPFIYFLKGAGLWTV